jgi:hypothetical protein
MTKITPISRTSTTERGSYKVNLWLKTNSRMNFVSNGDFVISGEEELLSNISKTLRMAKQTIVISAARIDSTLEQEIVDAEKKGVRVYVLLSGKGFDDWLKGDSKEMADHVLCRRSSKAIPSLILIDGETPHAKGILLQPGAALDRSLRVEGTAWGLNLNNEQASQLAHHVSWLFWSSIGPRTETRCANHCKAPQDTKPLRASLISMPVNTNISLTAKNEGVNYFNGIKDIEDFTAIGFSAFDLREIGGVEIDRRLDSALLPSPGKVRSGIVAADSTASKVVALTASDGSIGWLFDWLPDAKMQVDHQTALRLDANQAKTFNSIISKSVGKAEWNLMNDVALSTLKVGSEVRLDNGKTEVQIMETQTIDIGTKIVTPWDQKRLMEFEPHANTRPQCEPLAKSVKWTWNNVPPCPPKDAKPDLIERQFSEAIQKAEKADGYIRERLATHDKKGEKELKKLDKVTAKLPDDIRLINELKSWCVALKEAGENLKKLEDGGDSDIQRKKMTRKIDIPDVPKENRPTVGKLMAHGKTRFLAIDSWDDFEAGAAEADKQNAELCATRDVLGRKPE